jgi:hypothetical protein
VGDDGRPDAWIEPSRLDGKVSRDQRSGIEPVIVELDDILRDALSDLLSAESTFGVVVDQRGGAFKALSIDAISHTINADPDSVPSTAELLALSSDEEEEEAAPA